jgi:glycosyltransferase involved in cell wall biosynthesis
MPMSRLPGPETVLLFYHDFERDSFVRHDRYLKRIIRPLYGRILHRQSVSGFLVWYRLLVSALRRVGIDVWTNDYAAARLAPTHPVGLVGYPHILDGWSLPNPAILGPGMFDHPSLAPQLMADERYRLYVTTCDWIDAIFRPAYGDRCVHWHAGIDTSVWLDTVDRVKDIDLLVYDKVRWNRDVFEADLIAPLLKEAARRSLRVHTIRYGHYSHKDYRRQLRRSKAMLFLCEHETQGMAYQEALASGVPVLAWDNGWWLDPRRLSYGAPDVPATSVPFFSPECGARFRNAQDFPGVLDQFLNRLPIYRPRQFVEQELSFAVSARLYLEHYHSLVPKSNR